MDPVHKLAQLFAQFPGIGSRQSKRFVYFLLKQNKSYIKELVALIETLEEAVSECARCHRYFMKKHKEGVCCPTCADQRRERGLLMILEKDSDLEAVEAGGIYKGLYFVLGGTLPLLEKDPGSKIPINELRKLIDEEFTTMKEIIFAFAVTPESEHTADYVRGEIEPIANKNLIKLSTLGRGLSTGTELEYSDAETLRYALEGRK